MEIQNHCKNRAEFFSYFYGINDAEWFKWLKNLTNLNDEKVNKRDRVTTSV